MKVISIALFLGLTTSAWSMCTISPGVTGGAGSTVVFQFTPKPLDLLKSLGASDQDKSPVAVLNLLQSFTNQTALVMDKIADLANSALFQPLFGKKLVPKCRYYWIANQMFCDDMPYAILAPLCLVFDSISNVTNVLPNIPLPLPANPLTNLSCEADNGGSPWGLGQIGAPAVWSQGWKGQGIVIGSIDSGVRYTHNEIKDNFRGGPYSWYDPYKVSVATPSDQSGHGTHTMGTMVGKTVGVAPSATWIACRGCSGPTASCGNEQLLACGQWISCPDNGALNCTTRPRIVSNSWGGGVGDTSYFGVFATWKAMGIASFFSSGNSGHNSANGQAGIACSNTVSPADANYTLHNFLSVGAGQCDDNISSFSSVGPSQAADYLGGLAVQIVGPGTNIRSAWNTADDAYNTISGTSMSCPHTSGAGAVVLSQRNDLSPAQLYSVLTTSAFRRSDITSSALYCTSSKSNSLNDPWPNNVYGFGRLNLKAASDAAAVL